MIDTINEIEEKNNLPVEETKPAETEPPKPRENGRVKWFNDVKGYGFILDSNNKEIFLHRKHIDGYKSGILEDEDEVSFEREETITGPQARNIQLKNLELKKKYNNQSKKYFKYITKNKDEVTVKIHGKKTAHGTIAKIEPYYITINITPTDPIEIRKLDIKYLFQAKHTDLIIQKLRFDEEIKTMSLVPVEKVAERYKIKWDTLENHKNEKNLIFLILLEGESILGAIKWYNKYEICLSVAPRVDILVFRHAVHSMRPFIKKKPAMPVYKKPYSSSEPTVVYRRK